MQRFWDKYGLQTLLVIIGSIIFWGIFLAPGRDEEPTKKAKISAGKMSPVGPVRKSGHHAFR